MLKIFINDLFGTKSVGRVIFSLLAKILYILSIAAIFLLIDIYAPVNLTDEKIQILVCLASLLISFVVNYNPQRVVRDLVIKKGFVYRSFFFTL